MPIDFQAIAAAALNHAEGLVCELFPAAKRDGHEMRVGSIAGEPGKSLAVNLRTGKWADFASGDTGRDLVALWAAARSLSMSDAAREIEERIRSGGITATAPKAERTGRTDPSDWTPLPFAEIEASAPTEKRLFRDDAWVAFPVAASWCYRDADGRLVGYVCRVNFPDGSKDVFPFTYCKHADGRKDWRWKAFARPRPLYRLPELVASSTPVLIVEGEKTADAAARLLPGLAVTTWPGGSKAVPLVELEPLRGRRVTLWPDADKPGLDAMTRLADRLEGIAHSTFICLPPQDALDGWDLADAEQEGWTTDRVRAHVRARREAAAQAAPEPPTPHQDAPPADFVPEVPPDVSHAPEAAPEAAGQPQTAGVAVQAETPEPFTYLGYDDGSFFYLPNGGKQIIKLTAGEHKKLPLLQLAPLKWWDDMFGSKDGPDWGMAANAMIQRSYGRGVFSPRRIRGRGCWLDGERVVFHAGGRLLVDQVETDIGAFDTRYVYERGHDLEPDTAEPASNADAAKLLALCESLAWKHPLQAKLLAGWCAIAPICGVLPWRPHVWLCGPRGSGKTWTLENIIHPILGATAIQVQSATTEAGLRQALRSDALPVLFDEAESENRRGMDRMQGILEFARACSSESEAIIAKGTASGAGMRFKPRAAIAFSSIGVAAVNAADTSRITTLELVRRGVDWQTAFAITKGLHRETIGVAGWAASLRSRSLHLARVITANSRAFARAVGAHLCDARLGDQIGTLLAGAYSLTSRNQVDELFATEWVASQDWGMYEQDQEIDGDHQRALSVLLDSHIRLQDNSTTTIGELISSARFSSSEEPNQILMRHGVRVTAEGVAVSNSHHHLARIFADTPWAGKWRDQLQRVRGAAVSNNSVRFSAGTKHRAVFLPLELFDAE